MIDDCVLESFFFHCLLAFSFDAVIPSMSVQEHAGNEKSCVWHASDFADGELKDELFCIRFASIESKFTLFKFKSYTVLSVFL